VTRATVESVRKIDVNALHRKGCFADSRREFPLTWSIEGKVTEVVIASSDRWDIELRYHSDNRNEPVRVTVPITWSECHLGGSRPWFRCRCGRRVGILFEQHEHYVCRTCRRVIYQEQQFSKKRREQTSFPGFRIRERLGGLPSLLDPFPTKPKGMHGRTFNRLKERADAAEHDTTTALDRARAALPYLQKLSRQQLWDLRTTLQSVQQTTLRLSSRERMFVHIERPPRRVPISRKETRPMLQGDLISSRQLKAARALAGLSQVKLATEAGFNRDACRYWEAHGNGYPTSVQSTLDSITATLERHGVIVFRDPTPGARLIEPHRPYGW
jgi:ribosome-binding protein aMBF1 (putative translation factor)